MVEGTGYREHSNRSCKELSDKESTFVLPIVLPIVLTSVLPGIP